VGDDVGEAVGRDVEIRVGVGSGAGLHEDKTNRNMINKRMVFFFKTQSS